MRIHPVRAFRRADSGAAAVEFAITLPLLLLLFAGFVEFGDMLQQQLYLEKAVRAAGRYLSQWSGDPTVLTTGTVCASGNPSSVADAAENLVLYNSLCAGSTPLIANLTKGDVTITEPTASLSASAGGSSEACPSLPLYEVTVTLPYDDAIGLLGFLKINSITLTAVHIERQATPCNWI